MQHYTVAMLSPVWPVLAAIFDLLLKIVMICIVLLRKRGAASTLAWIMVILVLPLFGSLLYLMIGEVKLGRRSVQRHLEIVKRVQSLAPFAMAAREALHPHIVPKFAHLAVLAESVGDNDALAGNSMTLIGDANIFIQSLVEDIDAAQSHCHLLFYIYLDDHSGTRVAEALMRAAKRGVACRVLVDAVGSKLFARSKLRQDMEAAGVRVVEALPVHPLRMLLARMDLRNHRKIAVIDGIIGYTGSQNIADAEFAIKRRFAPWVDASVRIEGPVTWDLQMLFAQDWYMDTDELLEQVLHIQPLPVADGVIAQVMGTGPNSFNQALRQLSQAAFHTAREELILTTPYFVPDEATLIALCVAARRGVDTILVLPARNDSRLVGAASRSHYATLLENGVKIYEYQRGLLHAKTITVDRDWGLVSTANLDRRSFELNFEVSVVVYDDDFASQLRFLQKGYIGDSRLVDASSWMHRPWPALLWYSAAGTVSPLL
jgi:cardiolipin synthase A/B